MKQILVEDYEDWRKQARALARAGAAPEHVHFVDANFGQTILDAADEPLPAAKLQLKVPAAFVKSSAIVARYRDPSRWNLLYRILFRLTHDETYLLLVDTDSDIRTFRMMEQAVNRDIHKMKAFVRFRRVETDNGEEFIAWHRPDHYIVSAAAPFFARRFGSMRWAILTPDESVYWDGLELRYAPGATRESAPENDDLEEFWCTYYRSIFNPARLNLQAMRAELPVRHWATLPEAQIIPELLRDADQRVVSMITRQTPGAQPWIPRDASLPELVEAAARCEGCDLHKFATQTVFGEGPPSARVVIVGEQPGDQEDVDGRPFTGPAGKLLDKALAEAGIDRRSVYVTNAVKHFKFIERGKRRIHSTPRGSEVSACRPWLEAELAAIKPEIIVCLGATAAQALMGREFRISANRGTFYPTRWAPDLIATIHPSFLLRIPEPDRAGLEYQRFVADLVLARDRLVSAGRQAMHGAHQQQQE